MNPIDAPAETRERRPKGVQRAARVDRVERLSPHLVRVHFGGPGIVDLLAAASPEKLASTDKYVKILFADPDLGLEPPYDLDVLRETLTVEQMPSRRTYTVRAADPDAGRIAIDFVVHGDEGIAGPWAASARPGDLLSLSGPGGGYAPSPEAGIRRLLIADDSAIPAVAAALEALPADAEGLALIEVDGADDELVLTAPVGVTVRWLHRGPAGAAHGDLLVDAVDALAPVEQPVEVFAHGERGAIKRIRVILTDRWALPRSAMSISAYWASGRAEDAFQAEKREPVGAIFPD